MRVAVFEQEHCLGRAGNVNALFDRVDTPYFFLYFHDDILLSRYTETLLRELEARPDAVSAHCDMGHHGGSAHVARGCACAGTATARLMRLLLAPERGSPLRSLTRSHALANLRLPTDAIGGLWANEPYLMQLLAAGPAMHVAQTLYLRRDQRAGGLTEGWRRLAPAELLSAFRTNIAHMVALIDATAPSSDERAALLYALRLHMLPRLRAIGRSGGCALFDDPAELHLAFSDAPLPSLMAFDADIRAWTFQQQRELALLECAQSAA